MINSYLDHIQEALVLSNKCSYVERFVDNRNFCELTFLFPVLQPVKIIIFYTQDPKIKTLTSIKKSQKVNISTTTIQMTWDKYVKMYKGTPNFKVGTYKGKGIVEIPDKMDFTFTSTCLAGTWCIKTTLKSKHYTLTRIK